MKYIMGALGVIFLVILVVVVITRNDSGRGPAEKSLDISEQAREGVTAVMTQQGQLVGEDERRAIRIIVGQDERRIEILTGYNQAVERAQSYPNTPEAFQTFLTALDQEGFEERRVSAIKDMQGACPFGSTYIYELREFSQPLFDSWGTSCGRAIGNSDADQADVRKLFQKQITDYSEQIRDVSLKGNNDTDD